MQGANLLQDRGFKKTLDESPFQEKDLPGLSTTIADALERLNPEQRQEMRQALKELDDLSEKELSAFLRLITYIDQNPEEYPKFVDQLVESGAFEPGEVPAKYDPNFTSVVKVLVVQALQKFRGGTAEPAFAKGGIVSLRDQAARVKSAGRNGDSILAHISAFEAGMLNRVGAGGKVNPKTGLPEFSFWTKIRSVLVPIAKVVATAALTFFGVPPMISGAIVGGVSSLLGGGSASDALKAALIGGATAGLTSGLSSVFSGGDFLSGAFQGTGLFGGTTSSLFGGASAAGAAAGAPGVGADIPVMGPPAPGGPAGPPGPLEVAPSVPVTAAKSNFFSDPKDFFSKAMTPEGIAKIWSDNKVPILLAGGAGLLAFGSGTKKVKPPGIVGPTGMDLLAKEPEKYGFNVGQFSQQETPANPPVFPGGGYVSPTIAASPIPPPQFRGLEAPTGIMAAKSGGPVNGPGHGTSDSIPARLSDGEFVMTAKAVRGAGNGSRMKGARRLYELMHKYERMA
tara:strand:- start:845 stop:2377 length:1533 start_codon:yes stop_codon:yes gene_type:complete